MEGGWWDWEPEPEDNGREMILPVCLEVIDRGDIKTQYLVPENAELINMFDGWKRTGVLPYSGGTWEQPAVMMDILMTLDVELDKRKEYNRKREERRLRNGKR